MLHKTNRIIIFSFMVLAGLIGVHGFAQENNLKYSGKKETLEAEWDRFNSGATEKEIVEFISTSSFEANKEKAFLVLREKFTKLEFSSEKKGNTIQVTVLNPYFKPKFKDISFMDGLVIDQSSWESDFSLNIEIQKNEDYKIMLRDSIGREAVIPFGNTFEAEMEVTDSTYVINMLGEERPFHIELVNSETQERHSFPTHEDHIIFIKKALLNNGLSGEYAVKVGYGNNRRTMELKQPIYLENKQSLKTWIAGLLIVAIVAIGFFLFRAFMLKKPEEPIRFHK